MPASSHKGGTVPQSDKEKAAKASLSGPKAYRGAMVPPSVLADSKPSSPPERLDNSVQPKEQPISVQQMPDSGARPSQPPADQEPSSLSPTPEVRQGPPSEGSLEERDYPGWNLLGLEMDTKDPLRQQEVRAHPITGEVVKVPVGKLKAEGATPTPGDASLPPEAGLPERSPAPASATEAAAAPTTPTSTTRPEPQE